MTGTNNEEPSIEDINDVETILDSVTLYRIENKSSGGIEATALNLYIDIPEPSPEQWNELTQAAGKAEYSTSFNGYGKWSKGWTCVQCRGIDHPAGLCPFITDVPDWATTCGINIKTIDAWEAKTFPRSNSEGSQRGRGNSSRGGNRPSRGGYLGNRGNRGGRGYDRGY